MRTLTPVGRGRALAGLAPSPSQRTACVLGMVESSYSFADHSNDNENGTPRGVSHVCEHRFGTEHSSWLTTVDSTFSLCKHI